MDGHNLLGALLFLLIAVALAVPLFRRLKLGAILGYLVAGLVIGPEGVDLFENPKNILHFSEIGVVLLLFVIGLELSPDKLWLMRRHIAGLGVGQLLLSALFIGAIVLSFFQSMSAALIIGFGLALSSTAFAIQLMAEKGILASPAGRRGFAILLLQDLAVIPVLFLVQSFSQTTTQPHPWWYGVLGIITLIVVGRFALSPLLKLVSRYGSRESMTASSLLIVVGAAYLMELVGLSMGMGAFIAGIMLANSSYRHQLESDIEPFKGLTLGLFFIAIGMTLDVQLFLKNPLLLTMLAIGLMLLKSVIIAGLLKLSGIGWRLGMQMGLMLSQGGEFAFVVMTQASEGGAISSNLANQVSLIVGLSMALTSPMVALVGMWKRNPKQESPSTDIQPKYQDNPEVMIMGFGRFGQTTGRILAANGIPFIALDKDAEHIEFVQQFGNKVHFGDASRLDVLHAAGIEKVKVVLVATDEVAVTEKITSLVAHHYPEIKVIARARNRAAYWALRSLGAHRVVREVFKGSLDAAASTLSSLGFSTGEALKTIDEFESHDNAMMIHSYEHRDDLDKLIEIGRKGRADLERLFKQDVHH